MVSLPCDPQLLAHTLLYFTACLTGLVVCVPLGLVVDSFSGHCVLYSDINWINSTDFTVKFGNEASCHFVIYMTVVACIMYAFGLGCYYSYALYRSHFDQTIALQMWVMPFILSNSLVTLLIFVAACVLSVGFNMLCSEFTDGSPESVKSCADGEKWDWNKGGHKYNATNYFKFLTTAQSALWMAFLFWIIQVALTVVRYFRNRRERSKEIFDGDIQTSDKREIANEEPTA